MLAIGIWHGQPGQANNRSWITELPPLPSLTEKLSFRGGMIWVQLQDTIRLEKLAELLSLDPAITAALQEFPTKGSLDPVIPTDPLIYRFYEIMQVYGMPLKDVIQEHFGDGIMSAIDFTLDVDKVEDPKGDRVKITMCGKFLPYKKW